MKKVFENVFEKDRMLFTLDNGVFNDETISVEGKTYRQWEATRSKLSAAIAKGLRVEIPPESKILYLGAAHGYTVSFLSQICTNGKIFAVEFAPRVARELVLLSEKLKNILPIVADANQPNMYYHIPTAVDIVYQDIAQRNQVEILIKNCNLFLKRNGIAMIAIKSRSIDVTRNPPQIFAEVKKELEQHFKILDYRNLEPMQKDHAWTRLYAPKKLSEIAGQPQAIEKLKKIRKQKLQKKKQRCFMV